MEIRVKTPNRLGSTGRPKRLHSLVAPSSAPDPYVYVAKQVSTLPIWVFHGDADKSVSVEASRNMVKALKAIGADVQYSEFPGVDHNAWDPAYIPELQAFILARKQASHLA